jgi:hypothetical protein
MAAQQVNNMVSERIIRKQLEEERKWLIAELDKLKRSADNTDVRREGSPYGKREEEASVVSEFEKVWIGAADV